MSPSLFCHHQDRTHHPHSPTYHQSMPPTKESQYIKEQKKLHITIEYCVFYTISTTTKKKKQMQ